LGIEHSARLRAERFGEVTPSLKERRRKL